MSALRLYIATSLDGYIARENGAVDWLDQLPNPDNLDYGYSDFLREIDTILMGRKTYEVVMGFDMDWPYEGKRTFVLSQKEGLELSSPDTKLIRNLSPESIQNLKDESEKDIWLVGGGQLVSRCLDLDLLDEIILFVMPTILGAGIPLFHGTPEEKRMHLVDCLSYETGVVKLVYHRFSPE